MCDDPTPDDGNASLPSGLTFGASVYIYCDNGFVLVGEPYIVCLNGSMWSSEPLCILGKLFIPPTNKFEESVYKSSYAFVGWVGAELVGMLLKVCTT